MDTLQNGFIQATKTVTYITLYWAYGNRFNSILDLKNVTQRMRQMDRVYINGDGIQLTNADIAQNSLTIDRYSATGANIELVRL